MTSDDRYTPEDYLVYLDIDDKYHILVEGRDDKWAFERLLDRKFPDARETLVVDSAETFISAGPENREIVEGVCTEILNKPYSNKLVGFVDREFRDFSLSPYLKDDIDGHKVSGRVVWSRGHSIENYLFDFDILGMPLTDYTSSSFNQVLGAFKEVFESMMRTACAVSLAAKDIGRLKRVRPSIDEKILRVDDSHITINLDNWRENLSSRISSDEIEELFKRLNFWLGKTGSADYTVVRWLCDGHIGFNFIWSVYDVCVQLSNGRLLRARRQLRFHNFVSRWVQKAIDDSCEYPSEIFQLLRIVSD